MLDVMRILRDGGLLSAVACTYLLLLLRFNPRIFLRHYPKEVQQVVPPKSKEEKRLSLFFGGPLLLLLVGSPFASAWLWRIQRPDSSFWELCVLASGGLFVFNLVDLFFLDWFIVCWWTPHWLILPGMEHLVLPKPYLQHFWGFLTGTVFSVVVGFAAASLVDFLF